MVVVVLLLVGSCIVVLTVFFCDMQPFQQVSSKEDVSSMQAQQIVVLHGKVTALEKASSEAAKKAKADYASLASQAKRQQQETQTAAKAQASLVKKRVDAIEAELAKLKGTTSRGTSGRARAPPTPAATFTKADESTLRACQAKMTSMEQKMAGLEQMAKKTAEVEQKMAGLLTANRKGPQATTDHDERPTKAEANGTALALVCNLHNWRFVSFDQTVQAMQRDIGSLQRDIGSLVIRVDKHEEVKARPAKLSGAKKRHRPVDSEQDHAADEDCSDDDVPDATPTKHRHHMDGHRYRGGSR